jgi:hypothetical protein
MLAIASPNEIAPHEETKCYLSVAEDQEYETIWRGHPLQISAHLKNGTQISLILSFTETAELFALLRDTEAARFVRSLAEEIKLGPGRESNR